MTIFMLEWRNLRRSILSSTVTICAVIFLMLLFFPSMQTESMKALAGAKLEGIDPAILEALGLTNRSPTARWVTITMTARVINCST